MTHRKQRFAVIRKHRLRASYTIEAALILPVAFLAIALLIQAGFSLHDIVIGNLAANEAAELYGHLPKDADGAEIESYANQRLGAVLSGLQYTVHIDEYRDGSRVELEYADGERVYEDAGSRPESMMRRLTLLEAVLDK